VPLPELPSSVGRRPRWFATPRDRALEQVAPLRDHFLIRRCPSLHQTFDDRGDGGFVLAVAAPRVGLVAENLILRQQLIVARREVERSSLDLGRPRGDQGGQEVIFLPGADTVDAKAIAAQR
jgi:hypothetical protein